MGQLPLNLEDLLRHRTVEIDRIEYKAGWNADPVTRTLCAFANDFENLGGGYVVIGQHCDEKTGQPVFPPVGGPEGLRYPGRSGNLLRAIRRLRLLGLVELTIPDKPKSRNQKLKLTEKGVAAVPRLARPKRWN